MARLRIGEDLADVVLCVEERPVFADGVLGVAHVPVPVRHGTARTTVGQLGVPVYLDAPSVRIGQVPVQHVKLERGHAVYYALDDVFPPEMAAFVDQDASPRKRRRILDVDGGTHPVVALQLPERLHGVKPPGVR